MEIEACFVAPRQWDAIREESLGSYMMPDTEWPAVLKRSIQGAHSFSHAPGYAGLKPVPEPEHLRQGKIAIASALRAAGYTAWVRSPEGVPWQAGVVCQTNGRFKLAFVAIGTGQDGAEVASATRHASLCLSLEKCEHAVVICF